MKALFLYILVKEIISMNLVKFAVYFLAIVLLPLASKAQSEFSKFPNDIYWVNLEYQLSPSTFDQKLMVVITWDINDPVGLSRMYRLQALAKVHPQMQLVSIIKGDIDHPFKLSELIEIGQAFNINHPFGVTADLYPYETSGNAPGSKVFIYEKSVEPSLKTTSSFSADQVIAKLSSLVKNKDYMKQYTTWQMKNIVDPKYYADPLLEHPMAITADENSGIIYIAENAQSRISAYQSSGDVIRFAGGPDAGDRDGNLTGARIGYVSGLTYDNYTNQVFFVDLQNGKIKVADFKSELVYTFLGNGEMTDQLISTLDGLNSPLCFPVDVCTKGKSLYILMAEPAQLIEVDISSGKFKSSVILATKVGKGAPTKVVKGEKGFLITTSVGDVYELAYEGDSRNPTKLLTSSTWSDRIVSVAQRKDEFYALMPNRHSIYKIGGGKSELVVGSGEKGFLDGQGKNAGLNSPNSMIWYNGKLMVSDFGNHCIRLVNPTKGETSSIYAKNSFEYMLVGDALAIGEPIFFETEVFGEGVNTINIHWELGDWTIDPEGRNELMVDEGIGVEWDPTTFTQEGVQLKVDTGIAQEYAQVEVYLTLRSNTNPDLLILKRGVFNLNFAVIPGEPTEHDVDYVPHLLP